MEQSEKQEGNVNILSSSNRAKAGETTENEHQNIEGAEPGHAGRGQIQLGQVVARLQAARRALRYPARNVLLEVNLLFPPGMRR